jgi:hypothetical protein
MTTDRVLLNVAMDTATGIVRALSQHTFDLKVTRE